MPDRETFPYAPITEAVLNINVQLPKETEVENLMSLYDNIKDRFYEKEEQRFFKSEIKLPKEGVPDEPQQTYGTLGYLFRSPEEKKVVQSRIDGFSFNKLKPYENWELFQTEGQEFWELYIQIAKPIKVTRISLRYINNIEAPLPFNDFSEYILTNPAIAPGLPQSVSTFFMRLEVPNPDIDAIAIITQTMKLPTKTNKLPLILDIDVIKEFDYGLNFDKMWDDFEKLRNYKNDIFFHTTTEKAKELFR